jgi:hypothetical protein
MRKQNVVDAHKFNLGEYYISSSHFPLEIHPYKSFLWSVPRTYVAMRRVELREEGQKLGRHSAVNRMRLDSAALQLPHESYPFT